MSADAVTGDQLPAGAGLSHPTHKWRSAVFGRRCPGLDRNRRRLRDNALAESTIGLYKAECVHHEGPWRGVDDLELATLNWVSWFNETRLHSSIGNVPPAEFESEYYR